MHLEQQENSVRAAQGKSAAQGTREGTFALLAAVRRTFGHDPFDHTGDIADPLQRLADLLVPDFADLSAVALLEPGNLLRVVACTGEACMEEQKSPAPATLPAATSVAFGRYQPNPADDATGPAVKIDATMLDAIATELGIEGSRLEKLRDGELLPVRLGARDTVIGVMLLARSKGSGTFTPEDQEIAAQIAFVAALAIGSSRLLDLSRDESSRRGDAEQSLKLRGELLDAVGDAVIATNIDGHIIYWNRFAERLFGWRADEVIGRDIVEITPAMQSQTTAAEVMELLAQGKTWSGEMMMRHRDGSHFPAMVTDSPIFDERGTIIGVVGVSSDISARKQMEEELRNRTEMLETVNRIGRMLAAELDLKKLVQDVTDACTELTGARFGSFFYNPKDREETYMLYVLSGVPREAFAHFPMPRPTDMFGPTFRGEGVVRIADVKLDSRYGKNSPYYGMPPGHLPVTSYLAVPVISRSGDVHGGLFFGHPEPGMFSERMEQIVVGIAAQTAIAMDNAMLYSAARRELEERRKTEEELQKAMEAARAASSAKDQFLAVLSHELRTPLTPVLAAVGALEHDEALPEDLLPFTRIISRNIQLEARLIDDLLDLTRITTGKLELNLERVDVHALLGSVVEICAEELQRKRIELSVLLEARHHHVTGDPARLQQVFWNLLKNAVKFTPAEGKVIVETGNDREGELYVEVRDTGIGIEPELLPRIFNEFEQGEKSITRQFGGLGLGLAISRRIVDMHDGTLHAFSDGKGKGATFVVMLRLAEE